MRVWVFSVRGVLFVLGRKGREGGIACQGIGGMGCVGVGIGNKKRREKKTKQTMNKKYPFTGKLPFAG